MKTDRTEDLVAAVRKLQDWYEDRMGTTREIQQLASLRRKGMSLEDAREKLKEIDATRVRDITGPLLDLFEALKRHEKGRK